MMDNWTAGAFNDIVQVLRESADDDSKRAEIPCGDTADLIEYLKAEVGAWRELANILSKAEQTPKWLSIRLMEELNK